MGIAKSYFFVFVFLFVNFSTLEINASESDGQRTTVVLTSTPTTTFTKYRYGRVIFFSFSHDVSKPFFKDILSKSFDFDNYCGGENFDNHVYFGNRGIPCWDDDCLFVSLMQQIGNIYDDPEFFNVYNTSKVENVSAGAIDTKDVNKLAEQIISYTPGIIKRLSKQAVPLIWQVIVITDYVTDSFKSRFTMNAFRALKLQNVTFIALTTNITNERRKAYLSDDIWIVYPNYLSWTPESGMENPICGYNVTNHYTTPSSWFSGDGLLQIYLFLSFNYINRTHLNEVAELLNSMAMRKWQVPCLQYRRIKFAVYVPHENSLKTSPRYECYLEDKSVVLPLPGEPPEVPTCSFTTRLALIAKNFRDDISMDSAACKGVLEPFFLQFLQDKDIMLGKSRYLLITDVSLLCSNLAEGVSDLLRNFSIYSAGAPLTAIAIDEKNETTVADSYSPLFPPTQRPNFYPVKNISELLPNITTLINYCLNAAPWLSQRKLPYHRTIWYFYLIGTVTIVVFLLLIVFITTFIIMRKNKRQEKLRQIGARMITATATFEVTRDQYERTHTMNSTIIDIWEVPLKSLDINYKSSIGKGAFSVVHSGFLHGTAPVLQIYPSIAMQQYADCDVAVKTVLQHSDENERTRFRSEIQLMQEIGYHVHLVSMLGCNCSIERPILVLELAMTSLQHWLASNGSPALETDVTLEKTLLSIVWQLSNGLNYLSSKKFVHRDLATRNVLLTSEMKAMVSDFGLCQKLEHAEQVLTIPGGKMPIQWMALESLQEQKFSLKTDVWSFGVLLFEILSLGEEPFPKMSGEEILTLLKDGKRLDKPRLAKEQIYDMMNHCWQANPAQRPDFSTLQAHIAGMLEESVQHYGYLSTTEKQGN